MVLMSSGLVLAKIPSCRFFEVCPFCTTPTQPRPFCMYADMYIDQWRRDPGD